MPFIVTSTSSVGAVSFHKKTAKEALDKVLELEQSGLQKITVKDDKGRSVTRDQLAMLYNG
jgi:hypothetical protein